MNESGTNENDCPICFETINGETACHWPGCSHRFCFNCVVTQAINVGIQRGNTNEATNRLNCPLCRRNVKGSEPTTTTTTGFVPIGPTTVFGRAIDVPAGFGPIGTNASFGVAGSVGSFGVTGPTGLNHWGVIGPIGLTGRSNNATQNQNQSFDESLTAEVQNLLQDPDFDAFIHEAEQRNNF